MTSLLKYPMSFNICSFHGNSARTMPWSPVLSSIELKSHYACGLNHLPQKISSSLLSTCETGRITTMREDRHSPDNTPWTFNVRSVLLRPAPPCG